MSLKPKTIDFNQKWSDLQNTVQGVITMSNVSRHVWHDRFADVYQLCVATPDPLADKLYNETKNFLDKHVENLLDLTAISGHDNILNSYYEGWERYSKGLQYLHELYSYLNNQHIRMNKPSEAEIIYGSHQFDDSDQMEIGDLGLEIWRKNMIEPLRYSLVSALLECIELDRKGVSYSSSSEIVGGVIKSFVTVSKNRKRGELDLYMSIFEEPLLEASKKYFQTLANEWFSSCTITEYMERVIRLYNEEKLRYRKFLHCSSNSAMESCCEKYMVVHYLPSLYQEAKKVINEEKHEDMTNMYILLRSQPKNLLPYMNDFKDHIVENGLRKLKDINGDNMHMSFVDIIMTLYRKYKGVIENVFHSDKNFSGALDKACLIIVNHTPENKSYKPPEVLSKYCDNLLRKSSKGLSESETDEKLSDAIIIFKYLCDKDMFQKFYTRMLAKRLIHSNSQSMDSEESMIDKLKAACGYEFTNKLHRMFTDMKISEGLNEKFSSEFITVKKVEMPFTFSVNVLQAGSWPLMQLTMKPFALPDKFLMAKNHFETFYNAQFNGRRLTWLYHLCQGELKLNYLNKVYFVTMQTFQMAILLLFENRNTISCSEIVELLNIEWDQFTRNCSSLIDGKFVIMNTKELEEDTILSLNERFSNKRSRLKITAALQKDTPVESAQTVASVEEDRKLFAQATIVRIMKSRKLLKHNALIQEVISQCTTFTPSISMIKKCIETLIEKQYMERSGSSRDEYSYIA